MLGYHPAGHPLLRRTVGTHSVVLLASVEYAHLDHPNVCDRLGCAKVVPDPVGHFEHWHISSVGRLATRKHHSLERAMVVAWPLGLNPRSGSRYDPTPNDGTSALEYTPILI